MKKRLVLVLVLILALVLNGGLLRSFMNNLTFIETNRQWMATATDLEGSSYLEDGIPDGWKTPAWGGVKRVFALNSTYPVDGGRSVEVTVTNDQGAASLLQYVTPIPASRLFSSVFSRGDGGAIQIQFRNGDTGEWSVVGYQEIAPSSTWQKTLTDVSVPANSDLVALYLTNGSGTTYFDASYLGPHPEGMHGNLLSNPSFEQDGLHENPLDWWATRTETTDSSLPNSVRYEVSEQYAFQNIVDMMAGRYDRIRKRVANIESHCASVPQMTGWLLSVGSGYEERGEPAISERIYQLAIELMPECPQPYAALARLYETQYAFEAAAHSYRRAGELAGDYAIAGSYFLAAGLIYHSVLGLQTEAIDALRKAEATTGWETSSWYWGAAPFHLAQVLDESGECREAQNAYNRVLACPRCVHWHESAQMALAELGRCQP